MSPETSPVPQAHLVVGFDDSPPAQRALAAATRLLSVRPGRITVVWVAHLTSAVELSADAIAIVESDFDEVASELRSAAAQPGDVVAIVVGSSSSAMHRRLVGSAAVNLARHSPVPLIIVP